MPSAVPVVYDYLSGGYSQLREYIFQPLSELRDHVSKTDRGLYPNCGDGPFFSAKKRITQWRGSDGSIYNVGRTRLTNAPVYHGIYAADCYISDSMSEYSYLQAYSGPTTLNIKLRRFRPSWNDNGDLYLRLEEATNKVTIGQWIFPLTESTARRLISQYAPTLWRTIREGWVYRNGKIVDYTNVLSITGPVGTPGLNFRYGEFSTFRNIAELDVYLNGSASRFSSAYVQSVSNLPDAEVNSLGNILEIANAIKGLWEGLKSPSESIASFLHDATDPRNAWLAYRYSYSTTEADLKSYQLLFNRLKELQSMCNVDLHSVGSYSDESGSYRCEIRIPVRNVIPDDLNEWLSILGFEPTVENMWDLVPYSFVVDWFLHLSDMMELFDNWTYSLTIVPTEIWFTYFSQYESQHVFYRVFGRKLDVPPHYTTRVVSGKTLRMRIADAISLFT